VSTVTLKTPFKWCETEFSAIDDDENVTDDAENVYLALVIRTGAASVQTYATRDELRALGAMLMRHSVDAHQESCTLFAVWPDGTTCALDERRELAELLAWKSDDYEVKRATGHDPDGSPQFVGSAT